MEEVAEDEDEPEEEEELEDEGEDEDEVEDEDEDEVEENASISTADPEALSQLFSPGSSFDSGIFSMCNISPAAE